jgi:16S rRNA (guanine966-N2)-methyltransferase
MRIIAGKFRGRILTGVKDRTARPTTSRAKQTIFDILATRIEFESIEVLDLFCGTGSLGLEAISRGARHATFVDHSRTTLAIAEKNARALGCFSDCTFYQADVFWYLKNTTQSFGLVFADPPYKLENIGAIPERVYESSVLADGRYLVMEHSKKSAVELNPNHYEVVKKPFGETTVLILKKLTLPNS